MPQSDGQSPVQFICPSCGAVFRSKVYSITTAMIVICPHYRWSFQVELRALGSYDQWREYADAQE